MAIELTVPSSGESISEVYIGPWRKSPGDPVEEGEIIVELETDKATLELPAPATGTLSEILVKEGESVAVGAVIARIGPASKPEGETEKAAPQEEPQQDRQQAPHEELQQAPEQEQERGPRPFVMPAAARLLDEHGLSADQIRATGPGNRLLKEDVQRHVEAGVQPPKATSPGVRETERRPLTPIRKRIAERLVEAQHQAALLTTFNEVDMTEVIQLRRTHQEDFQEKHGTKLGFMSFFVKASVVALKAFPQVNAQIHEGEHGLDIVYHHYCDIGIAVGGGKGLVVPVLRNAESMSFSEIEASIADFARRAQENKLTVDELQGGTFTISNGGVYGSLLSTPIVNPPQSGILGLHAIQDRPVARDGQVVVRKMMYVALTYDHRIVDGREAVTFLATIKQCIEQPARMLLDV